MQTGFPGLPGLMALAVLLTGVAGCAGSRTTSLPGEPFSEAALADEVYLDGTGPSARRAAAVPAAETIYAAPAIQPGGVTRPVVRSRPTAIERDVSASTTGSRSTGRSADKPFSEAWWERERAEDARLKAGMNICRGC
jgi:hypothetical protein